MKKGLRFLGALVLGLLLNAARVGIIFVAIYFGFKFLIPVFLPVLPQIRQEFTLKEFFDALVYHLIGATLMVTVSKNTTRKIIKFFSKRDH